jgi:hypothetical protein
VFFSHLGLLTAILTHNYRSFLRCRHDSS